MEALAIIVGAPSVAREVVERYPPTPAGIANP